MAKGFFIFVLIVYVTVDDVASMSRIIGGRNARDNEFPYQVSLRVYGSHYCGGSILNNQWVLTAAHCLKKYSVSLIAVVVGTSSILSGGAAYHADKFIVHPDYLSSNKSYGDIGLIKIRGYFRRSITTAPINLPKEDIDERDCTAVFSGWGDTDDSGVTRDRLQMINLKILEVSECHKTFQRVRSSNICTVDLVGRGLCYGDSGSPLVTGGVQIAIAAWGSPCARGYPDVYTRVYSYIDWIKSHID